MISKSENKMANEKIIMENEHTLQILLQISLLYISKRTFIR